MKILVISDTHRQIKWVDIILEWLKKDKIEAIIHCGDNLSDGNKLQEKYPNLKVYMVPGNCDNEGYGPNTTLETSIDGIRTMITHGHKHRVNTDLDLLVADAMAMDAEFVAFGHTHVATLVVRDGVVILNPGSLTEPRDGVNRSFSIVTTSNGEIEDIQMWHVISRNEMKLNPNILPFKEMVAHVK